MQSVICLIASGIGMMDGIGGNPLTYAYRVTLEIEEKAQPGPSVPPGIGSTAKNLAEGINTRLIILP